MALRAERAQLLGFASYADFALSDQTAKNKEAVNKLLRQLAPAAVATARREGADMQAIIDAEQAAKKQPGFKLAAWDWAYYSEKVRAARYGFDESQLKPYLELKNVLENGVFYAAGQLYGLRFKERHDLPVYHPGREGLRRLQCRRLATGDLHRRHVCRPSKRGGAWANAYVSQSGLLGDLPVIANHLNIPKPAEGKPTLLTWDEVTTAFHEFGHALHGMFSNVRYPSQAGTAVPRDFVEFPSQVNEMWAAWPSVLANYARHYQTGAAMPQALLDKLMAGKKFTRAS